MIEFNREGIVICPDCGQPATSGGACKNCIHNPYRTEDPFEPRIQDWPSEKKSEKPSTKSPEKPEKKK